MASPIKIVLLWVRHWLDKKASSINHSAVMKDIYAEVGTSVGYYLILTVANLIALSGLIINSLPAIIGAMLISPLMGPILSFGFAFITGNRTVWRKSLKKLSISVALIIIVAGIATYLSPLKDITNEIVSRTRPNLYDLFIAFFAGTAGAAALCTKRHYITIVPGVAIATAVIPPLSVTGYGLGVFNWSIMLNSFFLFFTNFVAIAISTCIVFYLYGFRPGIETEEDAIKLKRRLVYLATVLFLISIPLIYTLHKSISEVKLRGSIQSALKKEFDQENHSRLYSFNYFNSGEKLKVEASISTVEYLNEQEIVSAEKDIEASLGRDIDLSVEQIKVQPGGLKQEEVKLPVPAIAPSTGTKDTIMLSRERVIAVVRQSTGKIESIISPSTIADFYVGFHDKTLNVSLMMKIRRDTPLTDEEIRWIGRLLSPELNLPIDLKVETVPFVPLLVFEKGKTDLSSEMKSALLAARDVYSKDPSSISVSVEAYPESSGKRSLATSLARKRADGVVEYLVKECNIPENRIKTVIHRKTYNAPTVKITIHTGKNEE